MTGKFVLKASFYTLILSSSLLLSSCQSVPGQVDNPFISQRTTLNAKPMMAHLNALEQIAKQHGGQRAVASTGGVATAKYIVAQANALGLTADLMPFENRNKKLGQNIVIKMEGQSKDSAIIIGGHYDSVPYGPGINDNGSGVAVLLELMKHYQQQKTKPQHTLYFAFWDSEEDGIGGSQHFVSNLSESQLNAIQAYINLDMVGTKDPTIKIADGDKSSIDEMDKTFKANGAKEEDYKPLIDGLGQIKLHAGDAMLEQHLLRYFKATGHTVQQDLTTLGVSDTLPFLGKVPVTTIILFNPQLNEKNELLYAPCYHQSCDTLEHIDPYSLELASGAVLDLIDHLNK